MYRNIINELATWFEEKRRRILYLKGALGVGKTWTIKDFSTAFFKQQIYINLTENDFVKSIITDYSKDSDTALERIELMDKYLHKNYPDFIPDDTIIIFDDTEKVENIDEFFHEFSRRHRHYVICLVESSMAISEYQYHHKDVFKILRMRPMTFEEYIIAKKSNNLIAAIESSKNKALNPIEERALNSLFKEYLLVGGLPEIVKTFLNTKDYNRVRDLQTEYISKYEALIRSSNTFAVSQRMKRIWKSIPEQLSHDNKKFMYRFVEENARAREYSDAVQKLCDLGLVRKIPRMTGNSTPIEDNIDYKSFELFILDHGILQAIYNLPISEEINPIDILIEKGNAVAEQYIFQELSTKMGNVYYWTSGATARVPFVYECDKGPVPVEIRFVDNKKAQNIKTFRAKFPDTDISVKISLNQLFLDNKVLNVPAYGLWNM